jgi:hypothetical protein
VIDDDSNANGKARTVVDEFGERWILYGNHECIYDSDKNQEIKV